MKVIDVEGAVLGRISSQLAKELLKGEKIVVVNAEKAVITGRMEDIHARYKQRLDRSDRANPTKGPHFPRTPDRILKRAVRGMLHYKTVRGKNAMKNLIVFIGVPADYAGKAEKHTIRPPVHSYVTLLELCEKLGWRNRA
jgi:large subunit ribosomal protein L13